MSNPAAAPNVITRRQWAQFVKGDDGQPDFRTIQDLEALTQATVEVIPADVAAAQATADLAVLNAATAQATATAAAAKLANGSFITVANEAANLPQSRRLAATGPGITATDGGAGNPITLALAEILAILPVDVADGTAAFVDATGLLAALAINSTYSVEAMLTYQGTSAVQGLGLTFSLPAGATITGGYFHNISATGNQSAYNNAAGAISGNTTATPVINTNTPIIGRWIIKTGATAGNAQLRFRTSNVAATITLKQDLSSLIFKKIG